MNIIYGIDMSRKLFWGYDMALGDVIRCKAYVDEHYSDEVLAFMDRYGLSEIEFRRELIWGATPLQGLAIRAKLAWSRIEIMKDPFTEAEIDDIIADVMKDNNLHVQR